MVFEALANTAEEVRSSLISHEGVEDVVVPDQ